MIDPSKVDWKPFKEKFYYWLFGEINFKTRWKVLMWLVQMGVAIALFYFVVVDPNFRLEKECKEFQPLISGIKSGELYVLDRKQITNISAFTFDNNSNFSKLFPNNTFIN